MYAAPRHTRATRREWIGLAVIALPCLLYAMDMTALQVTATVSAAIIVAAALLVATLIRRAAKMILEPGVDFGCARSS